MAERDSDANSEATATSGPLAWTREEDVAQENALAEGRIETLKRRRPASAEGEAADSGDMSQSGTENELGRRKGEAQKKMPAAAEQLEKIAVSQLKKRLWIWALPGLVIALKVAVIAFVLGLIIFAVSSVYMCAAEKGWLGTLWATRFGFNFTPLLEESFSGKCLPDSAPAKTDDTAKPAEAQNIPADQPAK